MVSEARWAAGSLEASSEEGKEEEWEEGEGAKWMGRVGRRAEARMLVRGR